MTDQVTSIEQSKRLVELGVPAEKASMVWLAPIDLNEYYLTTKMGYCCPDERDIPAFTVADLLGLFKPISFRDDGLNPTLEKTQDGGWDTQYDGWGFEFGEISGKEDYGFAHNKSLVDLLVGRIEWIVSNSYKLNI